jgi:hypothetical protein
MNEKPPFESLRVLTQPATVTEVPTASVFRISEILVRRKTGYPKKLTFLLFKIFHEITRAFTASKPLAL